MPFDAAGYEDDETTPTRTPAALASQLRRRAGHPGGGGPAHVRRGVEFMENVPRYLTCLSRTGDVASGLDKSAKDRPQRDSFCAGRPCYSDELESGRHTRIWCSRSPERGS